MSGAVPLDRRDAPAPSAADSRLSRPIPGPARPSPPHPLRRGHVPTPPAARTRVDLAMDPGDALSARAPSMDRRTYERMRRGRLEPEARLDLHGMTAERAHAALTRFVLSAHGRGLRLVLVITGKGRTGGDAAHAPHRAGVLRNALPHWLSQPPLAGHVLDARPAHARHGGAGAVYLYLRRAR